MFPLAGNDFPTSSQELAAAIQGALIGFFDFPRPTVVTIEGGAFPRVAHLKADLSGAALRSDGPLPPKPQSGGARRPGITADNVEVLGKPIRHRGSKLDFALTARGVRLDYASDGAGKPMLVLAAADEGRTEASISKADLESLARELIGGAAKKQGVTVQELSIGFSSNGPRSVTAEVRVKAKKMMMTGVIRVRGRLDVDDSLNATVSGLDCTGEGMMGNMAAGLVQGKLREFEGRRIPLMALSLGDVTLRDLKIDTRDGLSVTAEIGRKV